MTEQLVTEQLNSIIKSLNNWQYDLGGVRLKIIL